MLNWKLYFLMEIEKRIAINTAIEEKVVKDVIAHSLGCLLRSSEKSESMEITGFGTFYLVKRKVPKYIEQFSNKIEKLKVHLPSLVNESAIKNLVSRIKADEKVLIKLKERYGVE